MVNKKRLNMAAKIWKKTTDVDKRVDQFTVGKDRELDMFLASYDVLGSMAHIRMLTSVGLLGQDELQLLLKELKNIYHEIGTGNFSIEESAEDVHSQVELLLTRRLGMSGKDSQRTFTQRPGIVGFKTLYPCGADGGSRLVNQLIETLIKQAISTSIFFCPIYPLANCRYLHSAYGLVRMLKVLLTIYNCCYLPENHQSQPAWFGSRIWLFISLIAK